MLVNDTAHERRGEPVEADVDIHADHITDLGREIRVARLNGETGPIEVVPSQVHISWTARTSCCAAGCFFLADVAAEGSATYLLLYGNPEASRASLRHRPQGLGRGVCSRGGKRALPRGPREDERQLARPLLEKGAGRTRTPAWSRGSNGTIHWGPPTGAMSASAATGSPTGTARPLFDYDVVRGPVCVRIRRWGHPILSIGPQVGRPHKVMATVTYSFWAGQPYVIMESKLEVLEDVRFRDCRNDEFVIGEQLPERAWDGTGG